MTTLNDFGTKIFLDRYALKDKNGECIETDPRSMIDRVASAVAEAEETQDLCNKWEAKFIWLMEDWKFVPGGRILAGAGASEELTLYNCYVIPSPNDSREGVVNTLGEMTEIMSRGGGVGINLSTLRPKGARVYGVNGQSSGAVSWGSLYSFVTGLIEQGGSRRGALMLILADWHPDLMQFINAKREAGKITNANISVAVSDEFMQAVRQNDDWVLRFPDTTHPMYEEGWNGDIFDWIDDRGDVIEYSRHNARDIWDAIIGSAHASAEPGIWFNGRSEAMANSYYFNPPIATNPCGEQPLGANSVCNLGAINLAKMYNPVTKNVNWELLSTVTATAVRFLDNVIDVTPYFSEANEEVQKAERRVGLGVMGLADLFIQMGIRYGDDASVLLTGEIYRRIAYEAYIASTNLALEKGSFPEFNPEQFNDSGFMQGMSAELRSKVAMDGIRNVTLLTQAPTGTTGTMVNTSTGIEPFYAWEYTRNSRLGEVQETNKYVFKWREDNPLASDEEMPDHFVTAMDLSPEEHIKVQAAAQRWVDSAISKTCNVPNEYTVEQVRDLYEYMYDLGCKGGTIYRDGSRDVQVLSVDKPDPLQGDENWNANKVAELINDANPPTFWIQERGDQTLTGRTIVVPTPFGKAYVTINELDGEPIEVFINIGKAGSDVRADAEALGRLISLALQMALPGTRRAALYHIRSQLKGIRGSQVSPFLGPRKTYSLPDSLGEALRFYELYSLEESDDEWDVPDEDKPVPKYDLCPDCSNAGLVREEGCQVCKSCGWSAC